MKTEIWKDIKDYEGLYQISNFGRVRTVERYIKSCHRWVKQQILKQRLHNGYPIINLHKDQQSKTYFVHRLVALNFLDNPHHYNIVNHKDGIKTNNYVENLEWCTSSYNNIHAKKLGLKTDNISGFIQHNQDLKNGILLVHNGKGICVCDCSRSMAKFLIEKNMVTSSKIETISRYLRRIIHTTNFGYGYQFYLCPLQLLNDVKILAIKDGKVIEQATSSSSMAHILFKKEIILNSSINTISRSIRKVVNTGKKYHDIIFISISYDNDQHSK